MGKWVFAIGGTLLFTGITIIALNKLDDFSGGKIPGWRHK